MLDSESLHDLQENTNFRTRQTPEHETNCTSLFLCYCFLTAKESLVKARGIVTFHCYVKLACMMAVFSVYFGRRCSWEKWIFYVVWFDTTINDLASTQQPVLNSSSSIGIRQMPICSTKTPKIHHHPIPSLDHVLLPSLNLDLSLKLNQISGCLWICHFVLTL